jgi:penicillin-binding protein 1A
MGRDDAKAVPGLQGGTAPARAFSAFMRFATKNRPVEEFDTDVQLPEWQLEPDEEFYYGDPGDAYYYIDEEGNLIEPAGPDPRRGVEFPEDEQQPGEPVRKPDPRVPAPAPGRTPAPQAASDDFLDQATGANTGRQQQRAPQGAMPVPRERP